MLKTLLKSMAALTTKNKYKYKYKKNLSCSSALASTRTRLDPVLSDLIVSLLMCGCSFIHPELHNHNLMCSVKDGFTQKRKGRWGRVGMMAFASLPCVFCVYMCVQSKQPADTDVLWPSLWTPNSMMMH